MTSRVAAVVPVIDECDAIGEVVAGLLQAGACCVFVVDGGSRDGTRDVATRAGAIVVDEPRRGYGRACRSGALRALDRGSPEHVHDVVAFLDGDGSCDPADLPSLTEVLSRADVALGRRPGRLLEPGAMPWHARLGNALVAAIIAARTGRGLHDLPPFKAVRRSVLERLALDDDRYGWTAQLIARALVDPNIRVREVPVAFRSRRGGVSKVSGSWRASIRAGRAMIGTAIRETRPRPVIGLMAKAPGEGHAKTRLAAQLGEAYTADLWTAFLGDVAGNLLEASRRSRSTPLVMMPRAADVAPVLRIIGPAWTPLVQTRVGLSAALTELFLESFDRGADRAIAVAGDVPSLPPSHVTAALERLAAQRCAAVLGPSIDGGYHLVGMRWDATPRWWPRRARAHRRRRLAGRLEAVFCDVPMGGESARSATERALEDAGWRVTTVASWPDIDTVPDLRALADQLAGDGRWAPRTVAWIAGHGAAIENAQPTAGPARPNPGTGVGLESLAPSPATATVARSPSAP
ncbi:MAG: DUF2064 domain-containing protein [Candidatus Limnocylindrales bacterium]